MDRNSHQASATILALGLVISALLVAGAIGRATGPDRSIEVDGVAEREVRASLAVWAIRYDLGADSLESLRAGIDRNDEAVVAFLKLNGFSDDELTPGPPAVTDRWLDANGRVSPRYVARRTMTLRSARIEAVRQAMAQATELIGQGVSLSPDAGAEYEFADPAEVRLELVAEAAASARDTARRLAGSAGRDAGVVRRARLGRFSVAEHDPASPHLRRVRLVTTIEYDLQ